MRALKFVLAVVAALVGIALPAPRAEAAPQSASNYLASCAQSANTLSALFVFDRSGSLRRTDPSGIRYDALQIALQQLAAMKPAGDDELAVEAAVATFAESYDSVRDVVRWTRLDSGAFGGDAGEQQDAVADIVQLAEERSPPKGGTNFEAALEGALVDMDDRGGPGDCRVVFWFTDGTFDIGGGEDDARTRMCQRDGLLDRIREAGIVLVGIQLDADSSDLLPMSEGQGQGGGTCGAVPIPSDWAPGLYIRADDTAALKRIFGSVADIVQGCTPADGDAKLIDPGIRRFRATIDTPRRATALRLDAPDGTVISAALSGATREGGHTVTVQSDDHYVAFEVSLPPGEGAGDWVFSTHPATAAADTSLCVFHDLHFELVDPDQQISAGGTAHIQVRAVGPDGVPTDLSVFRDAAVGASAIGPDGAIRKTAATVEDGEITVTLESFATDARIELSLSMNLTTRSGLALAPMSGWFPIALNLAVEFPAVSPSTELDLGTAVKVKPASATLSLMGSPVGPSKVCFDPFTRVAVPQDAAGTVPVISDACVELQASQSYDVTVTVTPTAAAEGAGAAVLPVVLHSAATAGRASQEVRYEIPVVWRFSDPMNAPVAIAVLVVIGLISILLPLLAMGLANIVSAKFDVKGLQAGEVAILVRDETVRRQVPGDGASGRVIDVYKDRDAGASAANSKHFTLHGIDFRAHGTLNPFGAPRFVATAPQGSKIMSSVGIPIPGDRQAPVSPGLGFVVLAVAADRDLASASADVPATLVFIVRDTSPFASDPGLADRLANKSMLWAKITDDWRPDPDERVERDDDPGAGPSPWGGGPGRPRRDDPYFD
ncbi:MAG: VWA domain-containing protein [Propionibacteriaceae bacterium]|jgi:hypothetical protein|nr:VWA domain-containing protein [Propionibacteriaceae bacterium]